MSDAVKRVSVEIEGTEISFETGKMAKQASGAVVVRPGDTMVLCTATAGNLRDVDFLPLTVDVEERMYAAGKIPGSFFKREGRAGEKGTLTARMIDRPIRPLFPKGWRYETQLVAMPLSIDHVHPYDILAMNGASAALMLSDIPFPTPVGAVRIGKVDGNFVVNPNEEDLLENTELDLIVAGTDEAILMVEAGANEIPEAEILDALDIAHDEIKKLCAAQRELAEKAGKPKMEVEVPQVDEGSSRRSRPRTARRSTTATQVEDKLARQDAKRGSRRARSSSTPATPSPRATPRSAPRSRAPSTSSRSRSSASASRSRRSARRPRRQRDPRDLRSRSASCRARTAPRCSPAARPRPSRSSALGTLREEMRLDTLGLQTEKFYFHHYNFPPFSVGEAGFMRGPKRRDIGHGALAERALVPMVPSIEEFPTRSAWSPTSSSPTARPRWPRCAAPRCR